MSADNTLDQAEPTTAIHDPGQAWFLARYQVLRDIAHDVTLLGQGAAARGKTPTEMADRIVAVLGDLAQREWEGYAHHVGRRSSSLTDSLLQATPRSGSTCILIRRRTWTCRPRPGRPCQSR
ncbi:hypothetical protein BI313_00385 (plasmid) [Xanthomonas vesicatoria]|nr:hypothetical protein BI313_00385 [Xanthomonas vesicatoria]